MKQSDSSKRWLREHFSDAYVKKAHQQGLRSRAYFKLEELDLKEHLFKKGMIICDLGASPGGWSQYLSQKFNGNSRIFALDILPMQTLPGVDFLCGDFTDDCVLEQFSSKLTERMIDAVISDMAPNFTGLKQVDIIQSMYLAELSADFAFKMLKPGGFYLVKIFQGEGFDAFVQRMRQSFQKIRILKPNASRNRSREVYLLAKGFKL